VLLPLSLAPPSLAGSSFVRNRRREANSIATAFRALCQWEREHQEEIEMDSSVIPLYYLSSLAGLVMVVGGIWLLYKEKIYIDSESKQVTEIETPIGKFKTNLPALVLFALGFIPLSYPIYQCAGMRSQLSLKGRVEGNAFPVQVYAVVGTDSLNQPREFSLRVPELKDYKLLYVVPGEPVVDYQPDVREARGGILEVPVTEILLSRKPRYKPNDVPPVPAAFARKD
jgi:hypothetical protein